MLPRSCWALLLLGATGGFFGWLALGTPTEELGSPLPVPFEVTTSEDQFQDEATHWELSPLDSCQHQEELWEQAARWLRPRLETPVQLNTQQPALDGTLIPGRQDQVAQFMEDLAQRVGNVSSHVAMGLQDGCWVVLSNTHHTQERAQDVNAQLESNHALLLAQQRQVDEVMEKLQQFNRSLELMLVAVKGAQHQLEKHLQDLHIILHPAGWTPSAISICILHGSCFVLLVTLLVATPSRAILLLLFLTSSALGIPVLSTFLAFAVAGQWVLVATRHGAGGARTRPCQWLTSTPTREHELELLKEELGRMEMSCLQEPSCLEQPPVTAGDLPSLAGPVSPIHGSQRTKLSSCGVMLEPAMGTGKYWEPKPCNPSDVSLSLRSPCQGLTRGGQRCRKKAISGQDFCHVHATRRASCMAMDLSPHV